MQVLGTTISRPTAGRSDLGDHEQNVASPEAAVDMAVRFQRKGYTWSLTEEPTKMMTLHSHHCHAGALTTQNDVPSFTMCVERSVTDEFRS